jgi:hypothetical protein
MMLERLLVTSSTTFWPKKRASSAGLFLAE